jgi:hypothetical protein
VSGRKRRGSLARIPHIEEYLPLAGPTPDHRVGRSERSERSERPTPLAGKLNPAQRAQIRALAGSRSLRSLAAGFGVSHESVRAVIRGAVGEVA